MASIWQSLQLGLDPFHSLRYLTRKVEQLEVEVRKAPKKILARGLGWAARLKPFWQHDGRGCRAKKVMKMNWKHDQLEEGWCSVEPSPCFWCHLLNSLWSHSIKPWGTRRRPWKRNVGQPSSRTLHRESEWIAQRAVSNCSNDPGSKENFWIEIVIKICSKCRKCQRGREIKCKIFQNGIHSELKLEQCNDGRDVGDPSPNCNAKWLYEWRIRRCAGRIEPKASDQNCWFTTIVETTNWSGRNEKILKWHVKCTTINWLNEGQLAIAKGVLEELVEAEDGCNWHEPDRSKDGNKCEGKNESDLKHQLMETECL